RLARVRVPPSAARVILATALLAGALGLRDAGLNNAALLKQAADRAAPPGTLRVISWNTQYWEQTDDPDRFYATLKAHPADVYLLQEYLYWADGPQRIDRLDRLRQEFPGYRVASIGELITLSRVPIVRTTTPGAGPRSAVDFVEAYETAKILRTDVNLGGRTMSLYNVHVTVPVDAHRNPLTPSFYSLIAERQRQRERQFRILRNDLRDNPHPRLVSGDLNTSPAMGDLRRLGGGLVDAAAASRSPFLASWPAAGPVLWRLDWTFTDRRVQVHSYDLTDPGAMSDHRMQDIRVSLDDR
ncbi:MAG TPA: endonuclease/exonuclease/phosphatase family protein, partial [Actinoplanes sp.]